MAYCTQSLEKTVPQLAKAHLICHLLLPGKIDFLSSTILNGRRAFYILIQLNLVNLHEKNKLKTLRSLSIVVIGGKSAAYFFANHTAVFPVMTLVIKVRSPL